MSTDAPEHCGPVHRMCPSVFLYQRAGNPDWFACVRFGDGHVVDRCSHSKSRADVCFLALQIIADRCGDTLIREANLEVWKQQVEQEYGDRYEIIYVEFSADFHQVIAYVKQRDTGDLRRWTISDADE
jgi:hypothetical protein